MTEPKSSTSANSAIPAYMSDRSFSCRYFVFLCFLLGERIPEAERCAWPASIKTGHACFYLIGGEYFTEVTAPKSCASANSATPAFTKSYRNIEFFCKIYATHYKEPFLKLQVFSMEILTFYVVFTIIIKLYTLLCAYIICVSLR